MELNVRQSFRSMKEIYASSEDISSDTSCRSSAKTRPGHMNCNQNHRLESKMGNFEMPSLVILPQNMWPHNYVVCENIVRQSSRKFISVSSCESDNIIKEFENLHVNDDNKNVSSKNNADKVECRNKLQKSSSDGKEDENNNDNVTINGSKDNCKANKCLPLNIRDVEKIEQKHEDSYDSDDCSNFDDPDLIVKGPIRSGFDYQHQRRAEPYFFSYQNNCTVTPIEDIEKRAEEIMKNKDYSEKLNPCLDQLSLSLNYQNGLSIGSIDPGRTEENGFCSGDLSSDTKLPSIFVTEMGTEELIQFMKQNGYQSVQTCSGTGNNSIPSPRSTLSDSPKSHISFVSGSNSRASSRAQSPGSVTNSSGSPQMSLNIIGSPLGSPQVAPTYRVPQALLSSSSSNQSSPSNQSYSDVFSPLNHQTSPNFQLEDQFEILCSGDSSGTINETELNLIDQVIKDQALNDRVIKELKNNERNELKNLEKSEVTHNIPHFSSSYNNLKHEYLASNTQSEPMRFAQTSFLNNRTSYVNMCTSAGKEVNSPNYCMPNKCVPPNLYSLSFSNQTCYNTNIENPQIDVLKYRDNFSNTVVNNNERPVRAKLIQKMFHATSNEENRAPTYEFNNFRVPKTVSSSTPPRRNRQILPWSMLKLPSVSASTRLKQELNAEEVVRAMHSLANMSMEILTTPDKDGDTELMRFLSDPEEFKKKMAYLVPLIERLDNTPGALEMKNKSGENALYLAAMNYPEMSYIFGYLAAVMMHKGIDINKKLDKYNNTLVHCIAARGDSHGDVMAEILSLLKKNSAFDISSPNIYGQTALYIAVKEHLTGPKKVKALVMTRLLLENGADPKVKELRSGDTVLHIAISLHCDPALVKILLNADSTIVNERNYNNNTPLHLAAGVSTTVDLEKQKEVCRLLIEAGGLINIHNNQGKTPLSLVSLERKEIIKEILHRKL
ncbi:LOW QUALITY PROTEIN: probable serine/threonine-protein kinase clkA [Nylanderia fulva]|uniref:LOW QUALITY PROTEIN: probable serine/threonine-protein kinase clkA n=1 Tax=Nylanderia fulva TaxID=613905 RepID=UPI0010FB2349|nr:LOW QUALITY PROTEIN: probable serine/threonine-protein kinase clkA [Nylanderia fulva]